MYTFTLQNTFNQHFIENIDVSLRSVSISLQQMYALLQIILLTFRLELKFRFRLKTVHFHVKIKSKITVVLHGLKYAALK